MLYHLQSQLKLKKYTPRDRRFEDVRHLALYVRRGVHSCTLRKPSMEIHKYEWRARRKKQIAESDVDEVLTACCY